MPPVRAFAILAKMMPMDSAVTKATMPSPNTIMVSTLRKTSAFIVPPMDSPRRRVTTLASSFSAVSESLLTTPLSLIRFPSIRVPTKRAPWGAMRPTTRNTSIGKITLTGRESSPSDGSMRIFLSFSLVSSLEMGICRIGTRAMYV